MIFIHQDLRNVTVIIPTLNERDSIPLVISELSEAGVPKENIIVVDGHSTDGTDKIAMDLGVKVIHQNGKGKADAVREGLRRAPTRYAVIMDGDYTYPAGVIPRLLWRVEEGCSEVLGARVRGRENIPPLNRVGNKIITWLFNLFFGTRLRDVLTGMYLVDLKELTDALHETEGFSIEVELASHFAGNGLEVCEEEIEYRGRIGVKKLKALDGFKITWDLVKTAWRYNPVALLLLSASLLLIPGLILGAYVGYHYIFTGITYHVKGLIAIGLTMTGFNSLLLGFLSLYLKRFELRVRKNLKNIELRLERLYDHDGK
ncbi:MAG: glycosyltransferase family 2 protein [Thermosphaera sp.]